MQTFYTVMLLLQVDGPSGVDYGPLVAEAMEVVAQTVPSGTAELVWGGRAHGRSIKSHGRPGAGATWARLDTVLEVPSGDVSRETAAMRAGSTPPYADRKIFEPLRLNLESMVYDADAQGIAISVEADMTLVQQSDSRRYEVV